MRSIIVCTREPPTKFSKRRTRQTSIFRGGFLGKRREGGELFQGGCNFYVKSKPKPEIFNDKKSL